VVGRIGQIELLGGSSITADMEKDAADAVWGMDDGLIDGACLDGVFIGHFKRIVGQLVEGIAWLVVRLGANGLIADVYPCAKAREVDIDPVRIFRHRIKKAAIAGHGCVNRVVEAIGVARLVEGLILMRREVDPEVAPAFWRIGAVAGQQKGKEDQEECYSSRHGIIIKNN